LNSKTVDLAQVVSLDPKFKKAPTYKGIPACSGIVTGKPVFSSKDAINCKEPCILITKETTPEDYEGMLSAVGVITMEGGLTSHAAVVARGENKPCITGVGADIQKFEESFDVVGLSVPIKEPVLSMDGSTGNIWMESVPTIQPSNEEVEDLLAALAKKLDIVPVFTKVPSYKVRTAVLELGLGIYDPPAALNTIQKMAVQVEETLYVDMMAKDLASVSFHESLGGTINADLIVSMLAKSPNYKTGLKDKIVIIGATTTKFKTLLIPSGDINQKLIALIESTEELVMTQHSSNAVVWVVKHKAAEGIKAVAVGSYVKGVKSLTNLHGILAGVK
jgi:phosphohistidine swiveling domain-containing protein